MSNMICPGYVSNMTSAKCIGDVQINSVEFSAVLFFGMIFILGCIWSGLYIRKNLLNDAKSGEVNKK